MSNIIKYIQTLEKLSLITCSKEVLVLLDRALQNVEPIMKVETKNIKPLLWQNDLTIDRLHDDIPKIRLNTKDLAKNASGFFEDYIAVGLPPAEKRTCQ